MDKTALHFGPASIPHSTVKPSYLTGLERVAELGLNAFELPFVQFVNMSEESAAKFYARKQELENEHNINIAISVHAPYFVNLNAKEETKRKESIQRVLKAAWRGSMAGATNIVFHPGFYLDFPKEEAYQRVKESLIEMLEGYKSGSADQTRAMLRPETTGKPNQFGTLDELIALSNELDVLPCVDFAHLHARYNGINNDYNSFKDIFEKIKDGLGDRGMLNMHVHYSGIEYSEKGERRHLPLKESDAAYTELMRAFVDFGIAGEIICESPALEDDALLMQQTYTNIKNGQL